MLIKSYHVLIARTALRATSEEHKNLLEETLAHVEAVDG
jgi:hypothetical protein